jgi:hypothetical protein
MPSAVRDVVFNVAAKFPMKRMELGEAMQAPESQTDIRNWPTA